MKKKYLVAIILLGFSVYMGCKKDDETFSCGDTFIDSRDGQNYNTVLIGDQCWMAENLNVGEMINGTDLMTNNGIIEKYCYDNDPANCEIYGGLYQWNEMMEYDTTAGVQGICPDGWHLPTKGEWNILTDFLGGEYIAGGKMKETGTTHWNSPNKDATNEGGFTGLPAGIRSSYGIFINGIFFDLGIYGYFWTSTEHSTLTAWCLRLFYANDLIYPVPAGKNPGLSVRCLKD
jgi:uncharacterized protein (TIGR02145 family)